MAAAAICEASCNICPHMPTAAEHKCSGCWYSLLAARLGGSRCFPCGFLCDTPTAASVAGIVALQAVFFNHLFDPISLVRDHTMKQLLTEAGKETNERPQFKLMVGQHPPGSKPALAAGRVNPKQ